MKLKNVIHITLCITNVGWKSPEILCAAKYQEASSITHPLSDKAHRAMKLYIASTERKKIVKGWSWKNLTKTCDTYYTMYHKRRVKITRNVLCGKITGSELYYTPSLGKSTTCTEACSNHVGNIESGENHPTFVF